MNSVRVECLTPPGSAAIAVIELRGSSAWTHLSKLFRPASNRSLPDSPALGATWFGRLGPGDGDEVIIAVASMEPEPTVEVHCHGGRQVVRLLIDEFTREGCVEARPTDLRTASDFLPLAKTLRTASILLDQVNGAFERAIASIERHIHEGRLAEASTECAALERFSKLGRHLIEPSKVVIAGAPNAGKSSLLNALAGYQRSVVAPIPGTTRDVVTATLAFDGWLVELSDTAGLRVSRDELEKEGIDRAHRQIEHADLCLWVIDTTGTFPNEQSTPRTANVIPVLNKIDQPPAWDVSLLTGGIPISATTGQGLDALINAMVSRLVPHSPSPGAAVPVTDADRVAMDRLKRQLAMAMSETNLR